MKGEPRASVRRRRSGVWEPREGGKEVLRKPLPASLAAVLALVLAAGSATAQAQTRKVPEPLTQYVVSGNVDTDALARAGFDLREAG